MALAGAATGELLLDCLGVIFSENRYPLLGIML
jgi:hypothetical protein